MVKEVYFFTEMGYTAYPQDEARRRGYNNLMFPNEHFSPERAQQLYGMYFDELQYATESGFDGVMINEHHNNPLSMGEFNRSSQQLSGRGCDDETEAVFSARRTRHVTLARPTIGWAA